MNGGKISIHSAGEGFGTAFRVELPMPLALFLPAWFLLSQLFLLTTLQICYDAILMDFVMPVMKGPTATTEIRKLGYKGPIMGVTGNESESDREVFMTAGASHVFTKPPDVSLITKALQGEL